MSVDASTSEPPPGPPIRLMQQIAAYRTSSCIRAAVELGVAPLLVGAPHTIDQLAAATGARADLLARLLDHLVNEEVIGREDEERYVALPVTRFLVPGHSHSLVPWIRFELDPLHWRAWERLPDQIRSGIPAFDLAHGSAFFEWLGRDGAAQQRFDTQMRAIATALIGVAVRHVSFAPGTKIVDVGGGDGSLLAELIGRNPGSEGLLYELPRSDGTLNPHFEDLVARGRASVRYGSFFDEIPAGGDAYIFSRVMHDFDDHAVGRIVTNAKAATRGHERFIVIDIMVDPARAKPGESAQDMLMMVLMGGRERTADEFSGLLAAAGFATDSVRPTASPFHILEFRHDDRPRRTEV